MHHQFLGFLLFIMSSGIWINHFFKTNACTIQVSDLSENIFAIIIWHLHTSVVIRKCGVRHFQGLDRNRTNTSKIGLIALTLKNCLLSKFNSILFFKFTDHGLQELKLIFLLNDFSFYLYVYFFIESLLIMLVTCYFSIQLTPLKASSLKTFQVEFLTEYGMSTFTGFWCCIIVEESE